MQTSVLDQPVGGAGAVEAKPECVHQWMIDSPNGPQSRGVCRLCGEDRLFQNFIEGSNWGYSVTVEQLQGDDNRASLVPAELSKTRLADDY